MLKKNIRQEKNYLLILVFQDFIEKFILHKKMKKIHTTILHKHMSLNDNYYTMMGRAIYLFLFQRKNCYLHILNRHIFQ